tara:strand:- start:533 stop:691 length:159 start_codon:yes stop_codon:yes gene_type:complete
VVYLTIQKEKVKKKTKKINPRHQLVFSRLPEGEEWTDCLGLEIFTTYSYEIS